ncbi:MAG: carboxypeptidase regulatory-like domain-containing protein, partial [Chloracidobacterium sp.]|nr:carboxypeptidase regulatory-like domain-containing protein [Chloracidobacterium sp.]
MQNSKTDVIAMPPRYRLSLRRHAQTDSVGNFQFTNVRIGDYRVSAEKQGFSTAVAERVNVTVNA